MPKISIDLDQKTYNYLENHSRNRNISKEDIVAGCVIVQVRKMKKWTSIIDSMVAFLIIAAVIYAFAVLIRLTLLIDIEDVAPKATLWIAAGIITLVASILVNDRLSRWLASPK